METAYTMAGQFQEHVHAVSSYGEIFVWIQYPWWIQFDQPLASWKLHPILQFYLISKGIIQHHIMRHEIRLISFFQQN